MRFVFRNDTVCNKLDKIAFNVSDTWTCLERGEGEKEIANHGRSRVDSFSQETEAKGQRTPMIGEHEPRLNSKNYVQDALVLRLNSPFSLSSVEDIAAPESALGCLQPSVSDSPRAFCFSVAL
ncbi:hypothetical protein AZI86_09110 [Bdellovibrio bacteriovorus]|uniref:Uncharacterized protein n=1 Tax=Bdellovibrio bacteriovorus TaxID=959 RepID=A0A150WSB3_BDEBC|nr:hypothetical protein AZI86_09110 [Bdellovibrio bacteriovorus]